MHSLLFAGVCCVRTLRAAPATVEQNKFEAKLDERAQNGAYQKSRKRSEPRASSAKLGIKGHLRMTASGATRRDRAATFSLVASLSHHVRREGVADTANGLDKSGTIGILLNLLAQTRDQIVNRSINRRPVMALQQVHDVVAR